MATILIPLSFYSLALASDQKKKKKKKEKKGGKMRGTTEAPSAEAVDTKTRLSFLYEEAEK